jgi:ribosome maturation protein SDO1
MVNVDSAQIVKLKSHGHSFEILVDVNLALAVKHGKEADMSSVLAVEKVFSDAKKGDEASPNSIKEAFGTEDVFEVAKAIIGKGELPLTTEYKQQLREQKMKQIVNLIHRNAVDPQTHLPHPPESLENALNEAKFHVNEFDGVQKQMQEALKLIRPILPIKFEIKEMAVKIPADFAAKSYPVIQQFGKKLREDWQADGSYVAVVEIPGGLEEDFHNKLNALCHGDIETKILKTR